MPLSGRVKYRSLDTAKFNEAMQKSAGAALAIATKNAKNILKDVVGTQYASLAQLRAANHPYARRQSLIDKPRGAPPMPDGYINRQNSRGDDDGDDQSFFSSFHWEEPAIKMTSAKVEVQSDNQRLEDLLLKGTPLMRPRPFLTVFNSRVRNEVTARMANDFRRSLKINLQTQFGKYSDNYVARVY